MGRPQTTHRQKEQRHDRLDQNSCGSGPVTNLPGCLTVRDHQPMTHLYVADVITGSHDLDTSGARGLLLPAVQ